MAIRYYSRYIVIADTPEEFNQAIDRIKGIDTGLIQYEHELEDDDVLERAMSLAQGYIDRLQPFTYEDVGLTLELRQYRAPFREWLESKHVDFEHARKPRNPGFQSMLFKPYRVNEQGERMPAPYPVGI